MTPARVARGAPSRRSIGPAEPRARPLKVGIVSPYGYPHPGGVNEHVRYTYEAMRRLGHDVWIITSRYGKARDGGHVIRLAPATPSRPTAAWAASPSAGVSRSERATCWRSIASTSCIPRAAGALPVADNARPVGHRQHRHLPCLWRLLTVVLDRRSFRLAAGQQARRPIAVSGAARHFISRYFPGEYRIIPNGVDLDRYADAEPFEELRDGTINILFVGRFEERKG